MKVETEKLLKALLIVRPGLAKRSIVEQSTHFIFTGTDIITYNDKICISYPFVTDFICSVDSETLYKVLVGVTDKEIEISLDKEQLKLKSAKTKAGLAVSLSQSILKLVETLQLNQITWKKLPSDFREGLQLCLFSANRDQTQGVLTCVYANGTELLSCDNLRVSKFNLSEAIDSMLIPVFSAMELVKFNIIDYCVTNSWVHFQDEKGVIFCARVFSGDYPDISVYFDIPADFITLQLPSTVKDTISSMLIMVEGESTLDKNVCIILDTDNMILKAEKSAGWIEKSITIDYKGKALSFLVNPVFFCEVLEKSRDLLIFSDRAFLKSGNFSHIMALPTKD